jgi:hypothetical protein
MAILTTVLLDRMHPTSMTDPDWPAQEAKLRNFVDNFFPAIHLRRTTHAKDTQLLWSYVLASSAGSRPVLVVNYSMLAFFESAFQGEWVERAILALAHTVFHELAHATRMFFLGQVRSSVRRRLN